MTQLCWSTLFVWAGSCSNVTTVRHLHHYVFGCDEFRELRAELSELFTLLSCVRLLLPRLSWRLFLLVLKLPVTQWDVSPWRVLIEVAYRVKLCSIADLLELPEDRPILQMEFASPSTKMPFRLCFVYIWLHFRAMVHTVSACWFGVTFDSCLKFCIYTAISTMMSLGAYVFMRWFRTYFREDGTPSGLSGDFSSRGLI